MIEKPFCVLSKAIFDSKLQWDPQVANAITKIYKGYECDKSYKKLLQPGGAIKIKFL